MQKSKSSTSELQALLESEERFRVLFESAGLGIGYYSPEGRILCWNKKAAGAIGGSPKEFVGKSLQEVFGEDPGNVYEARIRSVAETRETMVFEDFVRLPGGDKWFLSTHTPVTDEHGELLGVQVVAQDISARKQAEAALQESESYLRTVLESTADGILAVDRQGNVKHVNRRFADMWHIPLELLHVGSDERLLCHVLDQLRDPEAFASNVRRISAGLEQDLDELVFKDGRVFERFSCPLTQNGELGGRVWSFRDITESKRANEKLTESEARFRRIIKTANEGIWSMDRNHRTTFVNELMAEMLGYTSTEMIGKYLEDFIADEDLQAHQERMVQRHTGHSGRYDCRFCRRDGSTIWLSVSVTAMTGSDGEYEGSFAMLTDITERVQADADKEKLRAQLNQAQRMESVGRLAGGVAHDFNNMLAVILGYVELVLGQMDIAHPSYADLQEVRKAAQRSADITRQLLAFARQQTAVPKVLNLNDTVEGMLKMLRRLIGEDIELAWLPRDGLWPVNVDPSQIDQILANLCINARDAISDVGKVKIVTECAVLDEAFCVENVGVVPGDYVLLAVSDDGCGMDRETLTHIFEPFFTTKDVGKGTGLGLATVYGIVKQNHGYIEVYSERNEGTTFKLYFPRYVGETQPLGEIELSTSIARFSESVLLVEDDLAILNLTKRILENCGYSVFSACTPREAIRLAENHSGEFNLLLTDVIMPEMNGRDLAARLTSLYPNIKCLFMSGYTADVIDHHGLLEPGIHFIHKPFSKKELETKVRAALEQE